jgi:peptidoglycan/LPS O-acetylase OafA/YrhL
MTSPAKPTFYRPELDCLRFFAFLFVFISHAFSISTDYYIQLGMPGELAAWVRAAVGSGGIGVVLFFVLSSYLITELLIREDTRRGSLDIKAFYIRRALRIWPLYFFFLFLIYVVIPRESIYSLKTNFLLSMLLFVGNWAVVLNNGMGASVAGPLWSISVEEQFYLAWPLVIARVGVNRLKHVCIGLIIFANLTRIVMEKKGAGFVAFWCSTVSWFDAIAAGALIALFLRGKPARFSPLVRLLLTVGGLVIWVLSIRFRDYLIYPDIASFPLIILGSVMLLLAALGSSLTNPVLVYFGRMSYGLYVFHALALVIASLVFVNYSIYHAIAGLMITIAMAAISFHLLEKPFLRLKKRFTYVASDPVVSDDRTLIPVSSEVSS